MLERRQGEGDRKIQAYNFRMFMTDAPNRLPWPKPANYDPEKYALLARYLKLNPAVPFQVMNGDCNNNGAFSTDHIGMNYMWVDGHYAPGSSPEPSKPSTAPKISLKALYELREKIFQDHVNYQHGLVWFTAHDPSVPQAVRDKVNAFGMTPGQFPDTGGWPHQLYIREGRRMIGDYVMTEHDCMAHVSAEDPVGLASYNMDSHNCQRVVRDGPGGKKIVRNEGDVQVGPAKPYGVSYRSIVPKQGECENLFVPVCLSSTHISYGSIRMEPVFMILGQSAGTAACMAIDENVPVQKVAYAKLKARLEADKQVLTWSGPARAAANPAQGGKLVKASELPGLVMDAKQAKLTGDWPTSNIPAGVDGEYQHDGNEGKGEKSARFEFKVPQAGEYEVRVAYVPNANRATNVPVTIESADGKKTVEVNQKVAPAIEGLWVSVGTYRFGPDQPAVVTISNKGTNGHVIVDAVQLLPAKK